MKKECITYNKGIFIKSSILMIVAMFLSGCVYSSAVSNSIGGYQGRVIDAETGKPLKNAVVLGVWYKVTPTVSGSYHEYLDSCEITTNESGMFSIPGPKTKTILMEFEIMIFKAGYESLGTWGSVSWAELKENRNLRKKIKWEKEVVIVYLRKLSLQERKSRRLPTPPASIPLEKIPLLDKELDNEKRLL